MDIVALELAESYAVELRFSRPKSDVETRVTAKIPPRSSISKALNRGNSTFMTTAASYRASLRQHLAEDGFRRSARHCRRRQRCALSRPP